MTSVARRLRLRCLPALLPLLTGAALTLVAACGDQGADASVIDRETFIATWVDLRVAAVTSPTGELSDAQRDGILQEHDVSGQDLLDFAEAHGADVPYMEAVWDEVESRMETKGVEGDSTPGPVSARDTSG